MKNVLQLNYIRTMYYTTEPIYSYMIGKNAEHNQLLISKYDHL